MSNDEKIFQYQPLWGKWFIDFHVGKGSYGNVYKVYREDMDKRYTSAVKIITIPSDEQYKEAEASFGNDEATLAGYFEDIVKNIVHEIEVLYSLSGNSNIINYQDHDVIKRSNELGWDILIRMEYVTSLRNYLREKQLSREEVIQLGIDICNALELCSKKGIVHRDIKDENLFVNDMGVFKLGDFGISKELSKSGRAVSMRGTPLFMAPEVMRGDKYDSAVDIYSLGIVLYKLLNSGRMPFMPPYPQEIRFQDSEMALEKRLNGQELPLPDRSGEKLGKIIKKACAFNASDRYQNPTDFKRDLDKVLAGMSDAEKNELVTIVLQARSEKQQQAPDTATVKIPLPTMSQTLHPNTMSSGLVEPNPMPPPIQPIASQKPVEKGRGLRVGSIVISIVLMVLCAIYGFISVIVGADAKYVILSCVFIAFSGFALTGSFETKKNSGFGAFVIWLSTAVISLGGIIYAIG